MSLISPPARRKAPARPASHYREIEQMFADSYSMEYFELPEWQGSAGSWGESAKLAFQGASPTLRSWAAARGMPMPDALRTLAIANASRALGGPGRGARAAMACGAKPPAFAWGRLEALAAAGPLAWRRPARPTVSQQLALPRLDGKSCDPQSPFGDAAWAQAVHALASGADWGEKAGQALVQLLGDLDSAWACCQKRSAPSAPNPGLPTSEGLFALLREHPPAADAFFAAADPARCAFPPASAPAIQAFMQAAAARGWAFELSRFRPSPEFPEGERHASFPGLSADAGSRLVAIHLRQSSSLLDGSGQAGAQGANRISMGRLGALAKARGPEFSMQLARMIGALGMDKATPARPFEGIGESAPFLPALPDIYRACSGLLPREPATLRRAIELHMGICEIHPPSQQAHGSYYRAQVASFRPGSRWAPSGHAAMWRAVGDALGPAADAIGAQAGRWAANSLIGLAGEHLANYDGQTRPIAKALASYAAGACLWMARRGGGLEELMDAVASSSGPFEAALRQAIPGAEAAAMAEIAPASAEAPSRGPMRL